MAVKFSDNPDRSRYEAHDDDRLVGYLEYDKHDIYTVFPHTEVEPAYRDQGIAEAMVRHAVEEMRLLGERAYPVCPYVKRWFARHPEYDDVLHSS
ncbi:MAG: GNAT family N-acetyltransferase [Stackebrandtia sp.]